MNYSVFDSLLDSVLVLDHERRIVYFNDACTSLLDLPRRRIKLGTPCAEIFHFEESDLFCMPNGTWGEKEASTYREVNFESPSQKKGRVQISIQPCGPGFWLIFLKDVTLEQALHFKYRTELKKKEEVLEELQSAHLKLEEYSKNLEKTVELRTSEISSINIFLRAILESLGQGFLIFDRSGTVQPVYSKACVSLLEDQPQSKKIWDLLKIRTDEGVSRCKTWIELLFEEQIPFEDLIELGPSQYPHSLGKWITLEFYPMRGTHSKIEGIVLVATDRTREREAELQAEKERAYVQSVVRIVKSKTQFLSFIEETLEMISELKNRKLDTPSVLRALHTIKGGAGTFSLQKVQDQAHELEEQWAQWSHESAQKQPPSEWYSGFEKLETELRSFFESNKEIIGRNLNDLESRVDLSVKMLRDFFNELKSTSTHETLKAYYLENFLKQPIQSSFSHVDGLIQEIAKFQGKKMKPISFSGGGYRIYLEPYRDLLSSLVHIFRNSVDHGIEMPEERKNSGKDEAGLLSIQFSSTPDHQNLRMTFRDDGGGIDPNRLREKLKSKGYPQSVDQETDEQIIQHIFDPGFSTREQITELSGRGIGMDAVASAVKKLGGTIVVHSTPGSGTEILIQVPIPSLA